MHISTFKGYQPQEMAYVEDVMEVDLQNIGSIITQTNWSPSVFKLDSETQRMHRSNKNFLSCSVLSLDIDDGMTIEEAKTVFSEYMFIIATTKSHQKDKTTPSGVLKPACDRYRVIIPLDAIVDNSDLLRGVWGEAYKLWPFIDEACKDAARYYAKSIQVVYAKYEGKAFSTDVKMETIAPAMVNTPNINAMQQRLLLSKKTLQFMQFGAGVGSWHQELTAACYDMKGVQITYGDALIFLTESTRYYSGALDKNDMATIVDVYENREAKPNRYQSATLHNQYAMPSQAAIQAVGQSNPQQSVRYVENDFDNTCQNMFKDIHKRRQAKKKNYPFICSTFDDLYDLAMGFILMVGKSGQGKSTVLANILAHLVITNSIKKRVLVISNEESTEDVYSRIACIVEGIDWVKYRADTISEQDWNRVMARMMEITKVITVQSITSETMNYQYMEDFVATMGHAEEIQDQPNAFEMILFDYWQTVNQSRDNLNLSSVEVSKQLGFYMKEFAARVPVPLIAFSQLKGDDKLDIKDRIENDKTLYNHAQDCIEILPNFDTQKTTFHFHKNRWGHLQGKYITVPFKDGKFIPAPDHAIAELQKEIK